MTFVKTTWNAGAAPGISAAQLNRMEQGIWLAEAPVVDVLPAPPYTALGGVAPTPGTKINLRVKRGASVVAYWQFIYSQDNDPSGWQWYFTGGAPRVEEVTANSGFPAGINGAYGDLAAGAFPTVAVPVPGEYTIHFGLGLYYSNVAGANPVGRMAPSVDGAAAADVDGIVASPGFNVPAGQQFQGNWSRSMVRAIYSDAYAGLVAMKFKYEGSGPPILATQRWVEVVPRRVGTGVVIG